MITILIRPATACFCAAMLYSLSAHAAGVTTTYTPPGTDWFNAANWSDGVPMAGDTAVVNAGKVVIGANATAYGAFVGDAATFIGAIEQTGGTTNLTFLTLGSTEMASGTYAMDKVNGGATLDVEQMQVGSDGYGEFDQSTGNQVTAQSLIIGSGPVLSVYNLNGGSLTAAGVVIGQGRTMDSGVGTFNEAAGSTFNDSQDLVLAAYPNSTGAFAQNGGTNTIAGSVDVGLDNVGAYTQAGGSQHISGDLNLGVRTGSSGTYTMTGGTLQVDGTIYVGGSAAVNTLGTGTFVADAGLNALSAETVQVNPGSMFKLTGPGGNAGPLLSIDSVNIAGGVNPGILQGSGTITGNINFDTMVENSGIVRPGQLNLPGTLTIDGEYSQTAQAFLGIQIGGIPASGLYDVLHTTGAVSIDGNLSVMLINGFTPGFGDVYDIVKSDNARTGTFRGLSLPQLPNGLGWSVTYTANDVMLKVVPEPSSWLLAWLAAASIAVARRRSRRR